MRKIPQNRQICENWGSQKKCAKNSKKWATHLPKSIVSCEKVKTEQFANQNAENFLVWCPTIFDKKCSQMQTFLS